MAHRATLLPTPLLLASASPRRIILLEQIGIKPHAVFSPSVDETPYQKEKVLAFNKRMAHAKAHAANPHAHTFLHQFPQGAILAADTIICTGHRILPKPQTLEEVRSYLTRLSGRRHQAVTHVVLYLYQFQNGLAQLSLRSERTVRTTIAFSRLTPSQIEHYVQSEEGLGKAGGYGIQGLAASFIRFMSGSYSNVVGLPLFETAQMLRGQGWLI